jgi:fimbrial chaperone protein
VRVCVSIAALLLATATARAATALPRWHISAGRLQIPAGGLATDFTVTNDDRIVERFEIAAYSWTQNDGVDVERPDLDDIVIVPRLFELRPGESERVRVGVLQSDPAIESDYRVRVEQLFDPRPEGSGVHFLLAFSLPLFTTPDRRITNVRIAGISGGRRLFVRIRNDGNVHAFARSMKVTWRGGTSSFGRPFYVLPHQTALFRLPMHGCGRGEANIVPDSESHIAALRVFLSIACR